NHMHNGDYSASKMEILFYRYILKSQKKHDKKYKIIKENEESSKKEPTNNEPFDNHLQKGLNENKIEKPQFIQSGLVEVSEKKFEGLECHSEEDLDDEYRISEIQEDKDFAKEKFKEFDDFK
ncbi:36754_t:CDS:2, partial [Gigaspora margarita]